MALHFRHYNFVHTNQTLRATPAITARLTERLWSIEDIATSLA